MVERFQNFDHKKRWGSLLENPHISNFQRNLLDFGRRQGLKKALAEYPYESVLDIGCGSGDGTAVSKRRYCGVDNSLPPVKYAATHYPRHSFLLADATRLPFADNGFDLVMIADVAHHLSEEQLKAGLQEMRRVSRKYVVVSDPVVREGQSFLSAFFYRLDRGGCFRKPAELERILAKTVGLSLIKKISFCTFPGLYDRCVFILEKNKM